MDEAYAARHEQFVSGHTGTTIWEVQVVTSIGPLALLLRNLAVPWLFPTRDFSSGSAIHQIWKFILDYTITIVPILLCITLLSDRLTFLVGILLLCCFVFILFSLCEHIALYRERPPWTTIGDTIVSLSNNRRPVFLTYFRAHIFIATTLGILAVDFPAFPRRFAKAETFGYGLMDVGVGLFVVANGIVATNRSRTTRQTWIKDLKSVIPLLVLGLFRLLTITLSGYHKHVSEYGVHWNFFFTLAFVKIFSTLFAACFSFRHSAAALALVFALGYEYSLQKLKLKSVIIYGTGPADTRDNLFDANREGICSIFGYVALYYFGVEIGSYLLKPRRQLKDYGRLLVYLINASFLSCILLLVSDVFVDPPSRRMVNLTYILWTIFLTVTHLTLFAMVETLVLFGTAAKLPIFSPGSEQTQPFKLFEPCLWKSFNHWALPSFLLANVITGFVNLNFRTIDANNLQCLTIMLSYSLVVCAIVFIWYVRSQKHEQRLKQQ